MHNLTHTNTHTNGDQEPTEFQHAIRGMYSFTLQDGYRPQHMQTPFSSQTEKLGYNDIAKYSDSLIVSWIYKYF
jgi:hypothetical protein